MLRSLNLLHIGPLLKKHEVDIDSLKLMSEEDLKEIGIAKGPRVKIVKRVQAELFGFGVGDRKEGGIRNGTSTTSATSDLSDD